MSDLRIHKGKTYDSFDELEKDIKLFEQEIYVNIRKSDGHRLETQKRHYRCLHHKDDLVYKDVTYSCKYSGKYKPHKSTGERNGTSCKNNCPFHIKFRTTADGQQLICTAFLNQHKHDICAEEFTNHRSQRKLDPATREEIARRCLENEDKKLLLDEFSKLTGKKITRKDICNIEQRAKKAPKIPKSPKDNILTKVDKFKRAMELFQQMASYLCECSTQEFEEKMKNATEVFNSWRNCGIKIELTEQVSERLGNYDVESAAVLSCINTPSTSTLSLGVNKTEDIVPSIIDNNYGIKCEHILDTIDTIPIPNRKRGRPIGSVATQNGLPEAKKTKREPEDSKKTSKPRPVKNKCEGTILKNNTHDFDLDATRVTMSGCLLTDGFVECMTSVVKQDIEDNIDINTLLTKS